MILLLLAQVDSMIPTRYTLPHSLPPVLQPPLSDFQKHQLPEIRHVDGTKFESFINRIRTPSDKFQSLT
jgi:hypothetical protein